jgi:cyclophilin family peptidyl-prolyl cis-trans isomerase
MTQVKLSTNKGDITIELDAAKAPASVANFLNYVDSGHYDGTVFHRVIAGFMIQGGGLTADMKQKKTHPPIKNEWKNGLKNMRGSVAMARLGGNADSATSQFFINVVDNSFLDRPQPDGAAYAVFGKVVAGMEVVDEIRKVPTGDKGGHSDVPIEAVTITKVARA